MDWVQLVSPGLGFLGIVAGGVIAKRKTKVESHAIVVTDATTFGTTMLQRAERAEARIDALEDRENRRDELARQHLRWDWRQVRNLADLGITVDDPPPLFLYDDPTPTKGH
jgi:hypothetical protein